ncbi:MAG: hypothetical protein JKY54_01340 [Flavobacteriales bacterium]|nr:hypothetical protein [Flavobacteriales bacterium]
MLRKLIVATLLIVICAQDIYSQGFYNNRLWRNQRHEMCGYFGASQFLGELGGRDMIGTDFIWDLEFGETKFAGGISYLFYVSEKSGLRFQAGVQRVSGNDNTTTELFRNNRNLHFRANIYEFSMNYEIHFIKEKYGNVYNLKSSLGKKLGLKKLNIGIYGFFGVGGFYFNPQAQNPSNGAWTDLHGLSTEGQGLPGGAEPYKKISINIPVGFGFRYALTKEWGIKLELSHRFTFTDYIDDVSGVYYDANALSAVKGPEAGYFSNPTNGLITPYWDGATEVNPTKAGAQRGDPTDRDGYMYAVLGIYYRPRATSRGRYKGGSKRRIKASF